jgi:hypothetical protein
VAVTAEQLAAELRAFDGRRKIVQAARRGLTRAAKPTVAKVRAHALAILPSSGGLGAWVSNAKIGVKIGYTSRSAGIKLRGSRKSLRDKSDLNAIDGGTVRHPSWNRRGRGQWHDQAVTAGWWSDPLEDADDLVEAVDRQVDEILGEIRRG